MSDEPMKINELLSELQDEVENNSPKSVFSNRRIVDTEIILEIITDIKAALPQEIKEAKKVIAEKEQIIAAAQDEAAAIIASAEDELDTRISESEVTREAEIQANELKELAQGNAKEIIEGAREYADDILRELESYFTDYLKMIRKNRSELSGKRKE